MADYKTPGVYVEEISTLPPSVGQVPTAIPAFIGYTQKARVNGEDITNVPKHITSMLDFHNIFGGAYGFKPNDITVTLKGDSVDSIAFDKEFFLYNSIRMFFANGGGECYITSVGDYNSEISGDALAKGLAEIEKEDQPTILVCPDAMLLPKKTDAYTLQQAMLAQCNKMQDRFAILDVHTLEDEEEAVPDFRNGIGINHLKYGAAYYPWIETTLSAKLSFDNIQYKEGDDVKTASEVFPSSDTVTNLQDAIEDLSTVAKFIASPFGEDGGSVSASFDAGADNKEKLEVLVKLGEAVLTFQKESTFKNGLIDNEIKNKVNASSSLAGIYRTMANLNFSLDSGLTIENDAFGLPTEGSLFVNDENADKKGAAAIKIVFFQLNDLLSLIKSDSDRIIEGLDKAVFDTNEKYQSVVNAIQKKIATLPPSGTIAGVYAQVDNDRGVWKAPANVSLASTVGPVIKIDNNQQESLNVDVVAGKSINAIRPFTGKGTLVWGARTLAGNDNEWRYVSVRRFFNMVEESIQLSTNWAVFEPNDVTTWVRVKAMIENYLTNLWKAGALAGSTPEAAYFVNIGLGSTMSAVDILEGKMNVEIGMAAVRPAEFIVLKFSHKLQEA